MSMMINFKEGMTSFSQYCLSESIRPRSTQYGTNVDRNNMKSDTYYGWRLSFFEHDGIHYVVGVSETTGETFFGVSQSRSFDPRDFDHDRVDTRKALSAFNKVMYLVLDIADELRSPILKFDAANPALGKVYSRMVHNNFFLDAVSDSGYTYTGEDGGFYIFKRLDK